MLSAVQSVLSQKIPRNGISEMELIGMQYVASTDGPFLGRDVTKTLLDEREGGIRVVID